jgi:hypothetical protein
MNRSSYKSLRVFQRENAANARLIQKRSESKLFRHNSRTIRHSRITYTENITTSGYQSHLRLKGLNSGTREKMQRSLPEA